MFVIPPGLEVFKASTDVTLLLAGRFTVALSSVRSAGLRNSSVEDFACRDYREQRGGCQHLLTIGQDGDTNAPPFHVLQSFLEELALRALLA